MCGACPGGGRLSDGTLFLAGMLSPARTAQLIERLTGNRLRVSPFGDGWTVHLPTGGMHAVLSFEELVHRSVPYVRAEQLAAARAELIERPDAGKEYVLDSL